MARTNKVSKRTALPQFYFQRNAGLEERERLERLAIRDFFNTQGKLQGVSSENIAELTLLAVGLPSYFSDLVFARVIAAHPRVSSSSNRSAGCKKSRRMHEDQFLGYYERELAGRSEEERLLRILLLPGAERDYLVPSDFKPMMESVLRFHEGLGFLRHAPEFIVRYTDTVIARIYYKCARANKRRLTLTDIRRSRLLDTLFSVEFEEDINDERLYFSYKHFYVLYCRFWELKPNKDFRINREQLMEYDGATLSFSIVKRIFEGRAYPLDEQAAKHGMMSYADFIWFCLSQEDKTSDAAIDYWFGCADLDGDGLITLHDVESFFKEQNHLLACCGSLPIAIRDVACQFVDMLNLNASYPVIRRCDLKKSGIAEVFLNMLFDYKKLLPLVSNAPIRKRQSRSKTEETEWDRFARREYDRLTSETSSDHDNYESMNIEPYS